MEGVASIARAFEAPDCIDTGVFACPVFRGAFVDVLAGSTVHPEEITSITGTEVSTNGVGTILRALGGVFRTLIHILAPRRPIH